MRSGNSRPCQSIKDSASGTQQVFLYVSLFSWKVVMRLRRRFGLGAVGRTRRTRRTTVAILAATVALALGIARAYHLGVPTAVVNMLVGGGALAAVYLAWASYQLQATGADLRGSGVFRECPHLF
jgi:hypothetical protein